ncbi:hypothetical protein TNCV_2757751 [Trichonephila clavipes]|nr:hypothetical protein TNCV_2757751 [Trichonephila clavipes]
MSTFEITCTTIIQRTNIPTAVTPSSSAQTHLLPSISSKTSTTSDPQPPTPMSNTKGKIKEQPSQLHHSPNETSPVSKKSRRRKTFKTSDAMDTDAKPSDSDCVIGLASEEDESLLEADFKKNGR